MSAEFFRTPRALPKLFVIALLLSCPTLLAASEFWITSGIEYSSTTVKYAHLFTGYGGAYDSAAPCLGLGFFPSDGAVGVYVYNAYRFPIVYQDEIEGAQFADYWFVEYMAPVSVTASVAIRLAVADGVQFMVALGQHFDLLMYGIMQNAHGVYLQQFAWLDLGFSGEADVKIDFARAMFVLLGVSVDWMRIANVADWRHDGYVNRTWTPSGTTTFAPHIMVGFRTGQRRSRRPDDTEGAE